MQAPSSVFIAGAVSIFKGAAGVEADSVTRHRSSCYSPRFCDW
jgi:hypothetical protein